MPHPKPIVLLITPYSRRGQRAFLLHPSQDESYPYVYACCEDALAANIPEVVSELEVQGNAAHLMMSHDDVNVVRLIMKSLHMTFRQISLIGCVRVLAYGHLGTQASSRLFREDVCLHIRAFSLRELGP